ncbi:kinesin-domain-containing protein [Rhizoclosmatium globosum]|uniref:Kinesin-like protein n=1 Tax=Rhizoclosmatium globosum TaxID=329046 RepID=A0A1Y2D072_9FUNG|nr:Kinesin-like protein kif3b [Rhizoclosmatium hyalinum]KAJ3297541.1 Kinesin-like protein kif3b [Rhizoclosmatium sp. JEL0117]ORY51985.1 kinesin-domain-containing protein [Rhizoclosmatium globosum]|eukprot:ORY51985.1 kinesin-domain-containing protein [Rhizoclosmatium globosum]
MPAEAVIVCVRCRPFSEKEKERVSGAKKCVQIQPDRGAVTLQSPKSEEDIKNFTFDAAFDENCTQIEVYNSTARIIVDAVLNGFNGTVFCYGQTGTGKTFSMQGISNVPHLRGIIPNAFNHIFDHIARSKHKKFLVRVSFLEIYNEEIRDLLVKKGKGGLELKEHPETGVYVKDLSGYVVKSVAEMEQLMNVGNNARSVGATLMNETSSRSHSIFTITIESSEAGGGVDGEDRFVLGKLHLVDLAGSERQSKTGASGDRLKEATKINLSLSALGNCISALVDGKSSHIPYRDSKLTRLLQDSLGGNAKTLMIATLSPASYNYDETLSTLRYANRAKNIKNKPKINEDPKDAMLREYQEEINKLKQALEAKQKGTTVIKKVVRKKIMKKVKKPSDSGQGRGSSGGDNDSDSSDDDDSASSSEAEGASSNTLSGLDVETIARLEAEVDAEKRALLASKNMVIEEKQRIAAELEKRAQELEAERQTREHIAKKLAAMEDKLLVGGVNIIDRVAEKEKELEQAQMAVREKKRAERELQQRLENRQELQLQMEENYASLQEEVDVKSKKLKKLWAKVQAAKAEISDLQDEFRNEREDLLDTIRELSRELSLKVSVIDNFIPLEESRKIESRATYDEETNDWKLDKLTNINLSNKVKRPCALQGTKRPLSQFAKTVMMSSEGSFRYYHENILRLKVEMNDADIRK